MRENEPVLLVLSAYDGKLFLRKGNFYLRNVTDSWTVYIWLYFLKHISIPQTCYHNINVIK